jgi:CRP/FNR family transcriptional regulator, cyclic AMP receptor protein
MQGLERILLSQPLFADLAPALGATIAGCARNLRFEPEQYLLHEGAPADELFLIRQGKVALQIHAPGRPISVLSTLGAGEWLGVSWLLPPYRWSFDACALEPTHAIGLDARCLRDKCESDHDLGYELLKRLAAQLVRRLHASRLQLLDVYRSPAA